MSVNKNKREPWDWDYRQIFANTKHAVISRVEYRLAQSSGTKERKGGGFRTHMKQGRLKGQALTREAAKVVYEEMSKVVQGKETAIWVADYVLHQAASTAPITAGDKVFLEESVMYLSTFLTSQYLQTQPAPATDTAEEFVRQLTPLSNRARPRITLQLPHYAQKKAIRVHGEHRAKGWRVQRRVWGRQMFAERLQVDGPELISSEALEELRNTSAIEVYRVKNLEKNIEKRFKGDDYKKVKRFLSIVELAFLKIEGTSAQLDDVTYVMEAFEASLCDLKGRRDR